MKNTHWRSQRRSAVPTIWKHGPNACHLLRCPCLPTFKRSSPNWENGLRVLITRMDALPVCRKTLMAMRSLATTHLALSLQFLSVRTFTLDSSENPGYKQIAARLLGLYFVINTHFLLPSQCQWLAFCTLGEPIQFGNSTAMPPTSLGSCFESFSFLSLVTKTIMEIAKIFQAKKTKLKVQKESTFLVSSVLKSFFFFWN